MYDSWVMQSKRTRIAAKKRQLLKLERSLDEAKQMAAKGDPAASVYQKIVDQLTGEKARLLAELAELTDGDAEAQPS